ncbi:hypothetical protein ABZT43_12130 [Streptomyces sp. NPDC005349]|uniref:hypothetical protein n=1 Tax=Streptomyces sp. NPDC005349 TaxID=3157037 RepID=UPI00339F6E4D
MAAITVGSVEVDVVPNTRGIHRKLTDALVPAATAAGEAAGNAAGEAFGPAMTSSISDSIGERVGTQIGTQIASRITAAIRDSIGDGITRGGQAARPAATRQGEATGSAFARSLKTRLEAAMRDLPDIRLNANSTDAEREIYQIRAQLHALQSARIGIDISSADAVATIARIQERLRQLSTSDADVAIRVDAAGAATQLAAIQAQVNRLDGQNARVDVDASTAAANLHLLATAALAFGPAIIPALPIVAAGLGAVAAAATAAGVGIGSVALVALPAFKQIGSVLQAQKAAQTAATSATNSGAQASQQAASKALQMASAQQALATAERNGARQIAQAQAQVKQAKQAAAEAIAQAAQRNAQAARQVQDAERALKDAQVAATKAQQDLTTARKQAVQELEDLNNRLVDSQLSQRDAEIALKEATAARDAVLQNANATELDKQKALLAYDQAVQRLKEQTTETGRLKTETKAANKAGVEGSQTVKSAQDQVASAQRNVADQARAVRDAQAEAARTQVETARQVADAQTRVGEATANVAVAQQNAADAVTSAQRQVQQASMSAAGGSDAAAQAQAKYRAELAKLTPSARQTFNAFQGLKKAFGDWSKALQPKVMPIFTRAINGLKNSLPGLTPFVTKAADAISGLQDKASKGFKSPWWKKFKKDLEKSIKPAITGLGVSFGRIFKGMVGIIDAFLPHMGDISKTMQRITKRFSDWGTHLKGSPEFEKFLSFASEKGPQMGSALKKIANAFLDIGKALSPVSGPVLKFIGILADGVATVAEHAPWLVQAIWGIIVVWRLWTIAVWAWNAAMAANPLVLIIGGLFLLAAAVIYCYNKFKPFRDFVDGLWSAIKTGAQATIDWFRGPFVRFFTEVIPGWFRGLLNWVKRNWPWILIGLTGPIGIAVVQIHKHWDKIKEGITGAWGAIKRTVLYPIRDFFTKMIPGWGRTLRDKMVGAFDAARAGIKTAWDKVKKIARDPVQYVVDFVYNNGIRRVWNLVTDAFGGKHLDPIKFATGGIMPGYTPGRDVHMVPSTSGPVTLSGGEAIMRPEWTRAVGPGYVNAMNSAARKGGVGGVQSMLGFKDGGIFSGIGDIASGAWDKVKQGASWLKDSFGSAVQAGVKSVVNPLINLIPGDGGFPKMLKDSMKNLALKLVGAGKKGDEKSTGPGVLYKPNKGVEQWRPVVNRALAEVHQPRSLANSTLRRMNQESGGNPTIVNKWDSNWKAGHPSVGLMQVIGPTFRSHAGKYKHTGPFLYGTSVNPMANIYSSMRYAMAAYGSLSRAYNRAGGYDSGGYLQPGLNLAYNGTGRPEPVFTTTQANALTNLAASGGATGGPASFTGDLYLDSGEFLGKVRGEAQQVMQQGHRELISVIRSN